MSCNRRAARAVEIKLSVGQDLDLRVLDPDLDDARLRDGPLIMRLGILKIRDLAIGEIMNPRTVVPTDFLADDVLGRHRPAIRRRAQLGIRRRHGEGRAGENGSDGRVSHGHHVIPRTHQSLPRKKASRKRVSLDLRPGGRPFSREEVPRPIMTWPRR